MNKLKGQACDFCNKYFVNHGEYGPYCSVKCRDRRIKTGGHLRHKEMFLCEVNTVNKFLLMPISEGLNES